MDSRLTFGEDVQNYDKYRPKYNCTVIHDICKYANIDSDSKIIEIGCGTGQATEHFLKKGFGVHAIELSDEMSKYVKDKFSCYQNFKIDTMEFEKYPIDGATIDLVYAATSFHWIREPFGFMKVKEILKQGGSMALFWNHPFVAREDDPLHMEIQQIYKWYADRGYRPKGKKQVENDEERYKTMQEKIVDSGFSDLEFHLYKDVRKFSSSEYINLLNTYSDHRKMEKDARRHFELQIADAINKHNGILKVYDTIDLYIAKK